MIAVNYKTNSPNQYQCWTRRMGQNAMITSIIADQTPTAFERNVTRLLKGMSSGKLESQVFKETSLGGAFMLFEFHSLINVRRITFKFRETGNFHELPINAEVRLGTTLSIISGDYSHFHLATTIVDPKRGEFREYFLNPFIQARYLAIKAPEGFALVNIVPL